MLDKENQQLELFRNELEQAWEQRHELGRLYYDIYNLKFWVYDDKENGKLKPVVKRDLRVGNQEITLKLRPQVIADDNEVKNRYLTEIDQNILDFILYKFSKEDMKIIEHKPSIIISINEIREKLKYDTKRIRQSLFLLSQYKVEFDNKDYEGVIPNQLLESVIIGKQGRGKKTLIRLSNGMMKYIYENRYILMNYENLFELDRLGKMLFKRICISNFMNFGETTKQKFIMKESFCQFIEKYGLNYKNRLQKQRLFKELETSLNLLKDKKIIDLYNLKPIYAETRKSIKDYNIELYLNIQFSNRFSAYQKNKDRLEKEKALEHLNNMKNELLPVSNKRAKQIKDMIDDVVVEMAKDN